MQSKIILLRQVVKQKLKSSHLVVRLKALSLYSFKVTLFINFITNSTYHDPSLLSLLFVYEVYKPSVFFTHSLTHASVHNSIESSHETVNINFVYWKLPHTICHPWWRWFIKDSVNLFAFLPLLKIMAEDED